MHAHYPLRRPTQAPAATRKAGGAHVRRLAGLLAAVTCGLLAPAAFAPAAFAMLPGSGSGRSTGHTKTVISAGGMAGWQITLIALGAALLAAAGTLLLERVRAARRAAAATTA
jgi:hypothetical protein